MKFYKKALSFGLSLAMCAGMVMPALAISYDIGIGDVHVEDRDGTTVSWQDNHETYNSKENGSTDREITVTQEKDPTSTEPVSNTVEVGEGVQDVTITLDNVNIAANKGEAAVSIGKGSDVTIELDGENQLNGGTSNMLVNGLFVGNAGLSVGEDATVTITDTDGNGSLTANGGANAAGIGGDSGSVAGNIVIEGGDVTGNGGIQAAGIGGGASGDVGDITIKGGTVTGNGGGSDMAREGAGIGSGATGNAGNIVIEGGNVTGIGGTGGAGIGAGHDGTFDSITIKGEDTVVNANGGDLASGIGTGRYDGSDPSGKRKYDDVRDVDSITIEGGTVTAQGGSQGAGIGTGAATANGPTNSNSYQTVKEINITGGNVTAIGGDYAAGIGGAFTNSDAEHNTRVDAINISGEDTVVNATGGTTAAGIGSAVGGNVGSIKIEGGDVTATGGTTAAGIGSAGQGNVSSIEITGGNVMANGGDYGAGIGAGYYQSTFGAVSITGGDIVAVSGKYASGIGNGLNGTGGTIAIQGADSLLALGDYYFAIDLRAQYWTVDETILNGNFMDQTDGEGSNGLTQTEDTEFVIVDANGNEIKRFTLTAGTMTNGGSFMRDSFAVNLPTDGKYYVFADSKQYGGSIAGCDNYRAFKTGESGTEYDGKKVAYVISEDDLLSAAVMQFPTFDVTYSFASGTDGQSLPSDLGVELPADELGNTLTLPQLNQVITSSKAYADVPVEGGAWAFDSWSIEEVINDQGDLVGVELVGTWKFVADPPAPSVDPVDPPVIIPDDDVPLDDLPEIEIDDEDVPLASAIGLNDVDHMAYIIGYDDDTVKPLGNITRAEVATIFFRLMTDVYRTIYWSTENDFSDVNAGDWYNNAISTCANAEMMDGYADGTFKPNQCITRAEFAMTVANFLDGEYTGEDVEDFSDTVGHEAAQAIRRCVEAGWIVRTADNTFRPDEFITRAEVMTIINRMLHRTPDADHMIPTMKTWIDNPQGTEYYEAVQEATNEHNYERDDDEIETWTGLLEVRDWKALEEEWADEMTED